MSSNNFVTYMGDIGSDTAPMLNAAIASQLFPEAKDLLSGKYSEAKAQELILNAIKNNYGVNQKGVEGRLNQTLKNLEDYLNEEHKTNPSACTPDVMEAALATFNKIVEMSKEEAGKKKQTIAEAPTTNQAV